MLHELGEFCAHDFMLDGEPGPDRPWGNFIGARRNTQSLSKVTQGQARES